jgi:HK97 family phage major capsid protein
MTLSKYAPVITEAQALLELCSSGNASQGDFDRLAEVKGELTGATRDIKAVADAMAREKAIAEGDALLAQFKAAGSPKRPGEQGSASTSTLNLSTEDAQELFKAARSKQSYRVEAKASAIGYKVAGSAIAPPAISGGIIGKAHEPARILSYIPLQQMDGPSIEFLTHTGSTGAAATVARGGLKPELSMDFTPGVLTARKIAVQSGIPDEVLADFATFLAYLKTELDRSVIDAENAQVLNGDGIGENLLGILQTPGLLVRAKGTDTALDAVEQAIADLRTGPAYTDPTALVIHPATWSSIRRTKDTAGRYLLGADPTAAEANTLWGLPVLATTTIAAGTALLGNLTEGVKGYVRQGLTLDLGVSGDDFIHNITRVRVEERIAVGVNRPAALVKITGL